MRFGIPRPTSPSPVRRKRRSRSTFGLPLDSDSDSESELSCLSDGDLSSASSELYVPPSLLEGVPRKPLPPKPRRSMRSTTEMQYIEDTVAAIRLKTRHHDPYEDWERQTRAEAFRTARKELHATQSQFHDEQERLRKADDERRVAGHTKQLNEVQIRLEQMRMRFKADEDRAREKHRLREKMLWDQIESVIKTEEDKENARLEAERRIQEEVERKRREEETRKRLEEERKKAEEDKRKAEEEKKKKEEEEAKKKDEEKKKKDQEQEQELHRQELLRVQREEGEKEQRKALGLSTTTDDWSSARIFLKNLKQTMKTVKADKQTKSEWAKGRRQFTAKIGQITDDQSEISRISTQLRQIVHPPGAAHPPQIFQALLSSLSKAILLQAETEVTAEKKSARPLAQVTFNLLDTIDGFAEVFFAKFMQRVGGWAIPIVVPPRDADSQPWENEVARNKALGYRYKSGDNDKEEIESNAEYSTRLYGIMRVYFNILKITPQRQPLKPMFQLPRYWTWVSRILGQRELLNTAIAAQTIYIALEVLGSDARNLWGRQWDKLLGLIYDGVTVGTNGGNTLIGGSSPEGIAARMRVQMEVERIMRGS